MIRHTSKLLTWKQKGAPGCSKCRYVGCRRCFHPASPEEKSSSLPFNYNAQLSAAAAAAAAATTTKTPRSLPKKKIHNHRPVLPEPKNVDALLSDKNARTTGRSKRGNSTTPLKKRIHKEVVVSQKKSAKRRRSRNETVKSVLADKHTKKKRDTSSPTTRKPPPPPPPVAPDAAAAATAAVSATTRGVGWIGAYSPEQRKLRIQRFLEQRRRRVWNPKLRYTCRKTFADSRLRVKGRFISKEQEMLLREMLSMT